MVKYTRFEDLPCWQKAREVCRAVCQLINKQHFSRDYSLKDQIWRAAGSAMDNIAEGFDDSSVKEFVKFLGTQPACAARCSRSFIGLLTADTSARMNLMKRMVLRVIVGRRSRLSGGYLRKII